MKTGFAALSTLDSGFYGKGMYFSSSALYCSPYFATKKDPVLLICLVSPGNPYPVIYGPKEEKNFLGAQIQSGYNSHYILTKITGLPITKEDKASPFDEIVIPKESQVCPIFMVSIDVAKVGILMQKYKRDVATNDRD